MKLNMLRKVLLVGTIGALAVMSTGCKDWGPLTSSYKGNRVVSATGTSGLHGNGWQAFNNITLTDSRNDGNNVYATTNWLYYYTKYSSSGTATTGFHNHGRSSTPEIANRTQTFNHVNRLVSQGTQVRIASRACAQMGWPVPDSCSQQAFATFGY